MGIPHDKQELLNDINVTYGKLMSDVISIPKNLFEIRELSGHAKGTLMSIKDLLSYLLGWGELVLYWINKTQKNDTIHLPATGYKWNELGKLAQKFYTDYEKLSPKELLHKLQENKNKIICLVGETNNDDLYEKLWYKSYSLGRMIQLNTSSPYKNARSRLRKWKKEKGLI